jgi:phage shock protein C
MKKRLYRSGTNKVVAGVCGGLGDYLDVDPTVVRIISALLFFASGGAVILAYIVGWIIMPKDDALPHDQQADHPATQVEREPKSYSPWTRYLPGLILILVGSVLLVREHLWWFLWEDIWPMAIIAVGLILIFARRDSRAPSVAEQQSSQQHEPHNGEATS